MDEPFPPVEASLIPPAEPPEGCPGCGGVTGCWCDDINGWQPGPIDPRLTPREAGDYGPQTLTAGQGNQPG